jgi:hypothetical protein
VHPPKVNEIMTSNARPFHYIAFVSGLLAIFLSAGCVQTDVEPQARVDINTVTAHGFLACGSTTRIINGTGQVIWSYPKGTQDGQVLEDGRILLAVKRCDAYPKGAVVIAGRDGSESVLWLGEQYEIHTVQPLANGRVLVAEGGERPRLLEIEPTGEIALEVPLQCQSDNVHMGTRMARKLEDGTYLAPHLLDFAVKRYDASGRVLESIDTSAPGDPNHEIHTWPFTAIRLPNGRTHVNLTNSNQAVQFGADGKVLWRLTNADLPYPWLVDPCGAQVLPNGNVVIACYGQQQADFPKLLEVTPAKEVVWTYYDDIPNSIHHFQILEPDGSRPPGRALK